MNDPKRLDPHRDGAAQIVRPSGPADLGLLLVHGRGAAAASMLGLAQELVARMSETRGREISATLFAPQAAGGTWYPGSFLAPLEDNQPWLDSGLALLDRCSDQLGAEGVPAERQVLVGFSQGACLACEWVATRPRRYGGLVAFTGGVQGPLGEERSFPGSLESTPVALSTGDPDPHVPVERVRETAEIFESMSARVQVDVYPGRPHTIVHDEIARTADWIAATL